MTNKRRIRRIEEIDVACGEATLSPRGLIAGDKLFGTFIPFCPYAVESTLVEVWNTTDNGTFESALDSRLATWEATLGDLIPDPAVRTAVNQAAGEPL